MDKTNEIQRLKEINAHLENRLKMATKLKYHLMPNTYPAFTDVPDIDIFADSIEVKQNGGDYYDFFRIDGNHIGIVIADIFEGGAAAALYMVAFKTYLTSQISLGTGITGRIEAANDLLCWENADDLCLSAWFGIYEISSGKLCCVNCGHERALLLKGGKAIDLKEEKVSYLLGVVEGMKYDSFEINLEAGDKLLLYTDGVVGAVDDKKRAYGRDRLRELFGETNELTANKTVAHLENDLSEFAKGSGLLEDASFLCFARKGGDR